MKKARACGLLITIIAVGACQRSRPLDRQAAAPGARNAPSPSADAEVAAPRAVTFNQDVAPILYRHCIVCHRPVNPAAKNADPVCFAGAPFSLVDFADARPHAKQIAAATKSRAMPPWLPEPGYGHFLNERRLRDDEIAVVERWVEQGAAEGSAFERPRPPELPSGWQLGRPDLVVSARQPYTLGPAGSDVFRNFVVPLPLTATRYVRGIELRADNPTIVHHASVGIDRLRVSRRLDGRDGRPGFAAMPDDAVQNVYGWSPGKAPFMEPADRAWPVEKGSDLVVQMHLLPGGKPAVIRPTIGLFFSDVPPTREPLLIKLESKSIDIPGGEANYTVEDAYVLPADIDVVSVYPHAHYLAKDMKGLATLPDGRQQWLLWIRSWDFRWQDQYRYTTPMSLPKGTRLTMRFTYDNSAGNPHNPRRPPKRVKWGPQSTDEMGALWLEVLPHRAEDLAVLLRDYQTRSLVADIAGAEMQVRTSPNDPLAHNFLATKYLQAGRVPEAIAELEAALRLRPDDAEAHSNLADALQRLGRLPDALQHAERAVQLEPDDDRVHFNLGTVMLAAGRPSDAVREFRRSVALNAENPDAEFNLGLLLGRANQIDESIAHFRRAAELSPQNADIHRNLAIALALSGHLDDAIAEAREAVRLMPDSQQAQASLADLLRAKSAQRGSPSPDR